MIYSLSPRERFKCELLERILEGMLGMLIGATIALAAFALSDPVGCIPTGCGVGDIALLLVGITVLVASAVYMAVAVLYCWRRHH